VAAKQITDVWLFEAGGVGSFPRREGFDGTNIDLFEFGVKLWRQIFEFGL